MYTKKKASGVLVVPNVINGQPVELPKSSEFPVINAKSGGTVHHAQCATVEVAHQACDAAAEAFKTWKKTPAVVRRNLLLRVADLLDQKASQESRRAVTETSCAEEWAGFDFMLASTLVREVAANLTSVVGSIPPTSDPDVMSLVFKEAIGPVLIIPPWNAPLILSTRGVATAIAAGCTVVLKASELCPWTHQFVLEVFEEAGLPKGVLNQVQATRDMAPTITEAIIAHDAIRKIEFIGSANVGRAIGGVAAKYLKPVLMELGDQSPAIVLEDADLALAAAKTSFGSTMAHGQLCWSTERIIVREKIAEDFSTIITEEISQRGMKHSAVSAGTAKAAKDLLDAAVKDGARFLVGDADLKEGTAALTPAVLVDVNPKSEINRKEGAGPFVTMEIVNSDEEAIRQANKIPSGLSASVFTKDWARGLRIARELEFGQVQINEMTTMAEPTAPVTGVKATGWGSNNAKYGLEQFMYNKHVLLRT